jgi:hypothetical protein
MDEIRRHFLVYQIVSGLKFITIEGHRYKLIAPSSEIRLLAEHIAQDTLQELRFENLITKEKAARYLHSLGVWSLTDDLSLKTLEKHLDDRKLELFQSLYNTERQKRMRRAIKTAKKNIVKAYGKKYSLDYMTLDYHALLTKKRLIISLCLRDQDNKPVYDVDTVADADSSILEQAIDFLDSDTISIEEFRELARTDPWRTMWNLGKESCIKGSASEWTDDQKGLMTFAKMYDGAYQSSECPSEEVFDDDDMFDGWMIEQSRARETEQKQRQVEHAKNIPEGAQEVFVQAASREEADKIYDLNDLEGRMTIQQRQRYIETHKKVDAKDLPDTRLELRRQQIEEYKNKFRKG